MTVSAIDKLAERVEAFAKRRPDSTMVVPMFRELMLLLRAQEARIVELEAQVGDRKGNDNG